MIEVEGAAPEEIGRLARLAAASLDEPWGESAFRDELRVAGGRLWVARTPEGAPAGYLVARRVADELHVLSLAVEPALRRRGVARALVAHALAAEAGCRVAHLEVRSGNEGAQAFYRALGFVAVGRRPRYYRRREDAILMTRTL